VMMYDIVGLSLYNISLKLLQGITRALVNFLYEYISVNQDKKKNAVFVCDLHGIMSSSGSRRTSRKSKFKIFLCISNPIYTPILLNTSLSQTPKYTYTPPLCKMI
jgi:hypothetical protein